MQPERNISKDIETIEDIISDMPQAECSVSHHFGDGIYIRQLTIPAGVLAVGARQKFKHNNLLMSGKIAMLTDGGYKILTAPMFFVGDPGRKVGFALETTVWQNIWATDETDIEILEDMYLDKSMGEESEAKRNALEHFGRQHDRDDYDRVVAESPFTADEIKMQVENKFDQCKMPTGWDIVTQKRKSNIQGDGMFCSYPVEKDVCLGPAKIDGKRTPLGRYTNHSMTPNAYPVRDSNGDVYFWTNRDILGSYAGDYGEEVTVDYRKMLGNQLWLA